MVSYIQSSHNCVYKLFYCKCLLSLTLFGVRILYFCEVFKSSLPWLVWNEKLISREKEWLMPWRLLPTVSHNEWFDICLNALLSRTGSAGSSCGLLESLSAFRWTGSFSGVLSISSGIGHQFLSRCTWFFFFNVSFYISCHRFLSNFLVVCTCTWFTFVGNFKCLMASIVNSTFNISLPNLHEII